MIGGRSYIVRASYILLLVFLIYGCANNRTVQERIVEEPPRRVPEVKEVQIEGNTLTIKAETSFSYKLYKPEDPFKVILEIQGVVPGIYMNRVIKGEGMLSEVKIGSSDSASDTTRAVVLLASPVEVAAEYNEGILKLVPEEADSEVNLPSGMEEPSDVSMVESVSEESGEGTDNPLSEEMHSGDGVEEKPGEETAQNESDERFPFRNRGKKISLVFQDADIVPIFKLLADVGGYNIMIDPNVKGKITMKLIDVPWEKALELILKTHNLDTIVEDNIIRIAPVDLLAKEKEDLVKIKEAEKKTEPLVTKVFPVSYAEAGKIKEEMEQSKILTERGSLGLDERMNSIIANDIQSNMPRIENFIKTLDRPSPQVLIEARVVEISTSAARDLGIQWGFFKTIPDFLKSQNALAYVGGYPNLNTGFYTGHLKSTTSEESFTDYKGNVVTTNNFVVDLPAAVDAGLGAGMSFGFLNAHRTFGLDLQLSALESASKGKIISRPKVITLNNQAAKILHGESLPYPQQTSEGTVSTAFKDVAISIDITPQITPDNSIMMDLNIVKEDLIGFVEIGSGNAPRTTKLESKTKVLVDDGETLVIGGIYKKRNSGSDAGIPWLKDIPVLGWLFKTEEKLEESSEIMIFITPRIVKRPET
jgi:type IV pilus assembly protein PilQ